MTLEIRDGKLIQIQSAQIIVSANPHSEVGWYSDIQIKAILPGCRKVRLLSSPTAFPGYLLLRPLFDHNGRADVLREVFRAFLRTLPIVSHKLFPVKLTPEIIAAARAEEESVTTCPAVQPYVPEVR